MPGVRLVIAYALSITLFGVFAPWAGLYAGRLLDNILGLPHLPFPSLSLAVGGGITVSGLAWALWAWDTLRRRGRGHPQEVFHIPLAPPPTKMVVEGPYQYSRHPMVFGASLYIAGIGLTAGSIAATLLSPLVFALVMVAYVTCVEEKGLIRRFGDTYEVYRRSVPLLIPRPRGGWKTS